MTNDELVELYDQSPEEVKRNVRKLLRGNELYSVVKAGADRLARKFVKKILASTINKHNEYHTSISRMKRNVENIDRNFYFVIKESLRLLGNADKESVVRKIANIALHGKDECSSIIRLIQLDEEIYDFLNSKK